MTLISFELDSIELDHLNLSENDETALISLLSLIEKILEQCPTKNTYSWLFLLSKFWQMEKCRRLYLSDSFDEQFLTEILCEKLAEFSDTDGPEAYLRLEILIYRLGLNTYFRCLTLFYVTSTFKIRVERFHEWKNFKICQKASKNNIRYFPCRNGKRIEVKYQRKRNANSETDFTCGLSKL